MESRVREIPTSDQVDGQQVYLSYLLRMWRMACDEETTDLRSEWLNWRASLESVRTGERMGFGSLEDLFGFLRKQMGVEDGCAGE